MCGRFTQQRPSAELAALFAADDLAETPGGRYNLAPQQTGLVVVERPEEGRAIAAYRWGLVPTWAKDARIGNRLINARAETVATTAAFRSAFQKRRCLVPADAFYEWERVAESIRQPNLIRRADGEPMAFAGLWSPWRDWGAWLDPGTPDPGALRDLLRPAPDDLLIRYPVTKRVNNARNEGPDLVVPLGPLGPDPGVRQLTLG